MASLKGIGDWFKGLGSAISSLFTSVIQTEVSTIDTYQRALNDVQAAVQVFKDFEHFEFDPKFKTRVISVPKAWEGINELFDIVVHGLHDKFVELEGAVRILLGNLQSVLSPTRPGDEGPSAVGDIASKVAQMEVALVSFGDAFHEAVQFVQMLDDVKSRVETLDDLFLPQNKARKFLTERSYKRISL